jgi:hypothetical protein
LNSERFSQANLQQVSCVESLIVTQEHFHSSVPVALEPVEAFLVEGRDEVDGVADLTAEEGLEDVPSALAVNIWVSEDPFDV